MSFQNDILIVDSEISDLRLLTELLERNGYKVRPAETVKMAIDKALTQPPGLILMEIQMPDMDGYEACRRLMQEKLTRDVPVIFISSLGDSQSKVQAFEVGGVDFVSKPFIEQEVLARVRTHFHLHQMQQNIKRLVEERTAEMMAEFRGRQRAENKYLTFVKKSSEGIWAYDIEPPIPMDLPVEDQLDLLYERARISEANDTVVRMFGFENEEDVLGMRLNDFQPRTNPENVAYMKNIVLEKFNVTDFETTAYGAAGEKLILLSNILGIIEDGKLLRLWGTSRDIAQQRENDKKLQQSEKRFRNLMEQSPLAMEILNPTGQIIKINKAWQQLWGINEEEAKEVTASYNMLDDPQIVELGIAPQVQKAFAGEPVILPMIEYSGQRAAKDVDMPGLQVKTVWIQCHLFPVKDKQNEIEFVVNTYNDLSAQIIANQERERILTLSKDLISIAGTDGYLKYVNPVWEPTLGYSAKELLEHPFLDFIHPEDQERTKQELYSLADGQPTFDFELRAVCKDGSIRHISWMVTPYVKENLLYCIGRDITDRKKSEGEALKQREIMARVGRTTRLGELTGSIAHELNQPLTGILSNAQAGELMIKKGQYNHNEMAEILADIAADTKRAGEVIRNLRELYREQKGEHESVDINAIIEETIKLIQSELIIQNILLTKEYSPSIPRVNGNRIQLQQVLINLISNGIEAMSVLVKNDRRLHIAAIYAANEVKVWLEDNGPGIDPEKIDGIFEPLATWKSGGTGMGLAISNSIIEAHDGKMWTENMPEGGARVGFTLPVLKGGEEA